MDSTRPPTPLGNGCYSVPSSDPAKAPYRVNVPDGLCECTGWGYRNTCRHLDLCREIEQRQRQARAGLRRDIDALRQQRVRSLDLDTCVTCHTRPAAPGRAECGFCALQGAFV